SAEGLGRVVCELYNQFLGRDPDPAGLTVWTQFLAQVGTRQQLAAILIASPEYYALKGGTNEDFVKGVYKDYFGRDADPDGVAFWTGAMAQGLATFGVARGLLFSREGDLTQVNILYNKLFGRDGSPDELGYWADQLRRESLNQLARDLIFSGS